MNREQIKQAIRRLRRMPYAPDRERIIQGYRRSLRILQLTENPSFESCLDKAMKKIYIEKID